MPVWISATRSRTRATLPSSTSTAELMHSRSPSCGASSWSGSDQSAPTLGSNPGPPKWGAGFSCPLGLLTGGPRYCGLKVRVTILIHSGLPNHSRFSHLERQSRSAELPLRGTAEFHSVDGGFAEHLPDKTPLDRRQARSAFGLTQLLAATRYELVMERDIRPILDDIRAQLG